MSRIKDQSWLAAIAALLACSIVAGCASLDLDDDSSHAEISYPLGPSANLDYAVEQTQARVYELGIHYPFRVVVRRQQGRSVRIAAWSTDNRFLGDISVVPPYEATIWNKLNLFLPYSRIAFGGERIDGNVYVLAPGDARRFLATASMSVTKIPRERFVWRFNDFLEDTTLPSGAKGIRVIVNLDRFGFADVSHRVVLVVRDANRRDFPSSLGGPIHIDSKRLSAPADTGQINWNLELDLAYDQIKQLGEGHVITLTPSVRMADGSLEIGNLHIEFLVGGSPGKIAARMRHEVERLDSRIRTLQRELELLQRQ